MKKIVLIATLLVFAGFTASAQIGYGVKVGLPSYIGEDAEDLIADTAIGFGVFLDVEIPLGSLLSIQGDGGYYYDVLMFEDGFDTLTTSWISTQLRLFGKLKLPLGPITPFVKGGMVVTYIGMGTASDGYNSAEITVDNNMLYGYAVEAGFGFKNLAGKTVELAAFYQEHITSYDFEDDISLGSMGVSITTKLW
ncbi:MAG: hypothetical protein OCD02_15155 [Spirochaetaceae bacterium]